MDFGIFNLMQQRGARVTSAELIDDAIHHTRIAESLGFGRAWFAEHHFSNYSLCPSPLMMVAHAAAVTERIRLGTAVIVAPLHAPARLLGEIGLADSLSGGRLDLGIGNGYQHFEFERFGVDIEECRERMFEMLDMIELGLTGKVFEYRGTHYRQPPTAINVRCVQQPHPPIWMASGAHAVNGRAARHGYTPFVSSRFANQEELAPIREHIAESFRHEGKGDRPMPLGILSYGCVSESRRDIAQYADAARFQGRIARSLRERREQVESDHSITPVPFANEPSLDAIEASILCGDPETVAEKLVSSAGGPWCFFHNAQEAFGSRSCRSRSRRRSCGVHGRSCAAQYAGLITGYSSSSISGRHVSPGQGRPPIRIARSAPSSAGAWRR